MTKVHLCFNPACNYSPSCVDINIGFGKRRHQTRQKISINIYLCHLPLTGSSTAWLWMHDKFQLNSNLPLCRHELFDFRCPSQTTYQLWKLSTTEDPMYKYFPSCSLRDMLPSWLCIQLSIQARLTSVSRQLTGSFQCRTWKTNLFPACSSPAEHWGYYHFVASTAGCCVAVTGSVLSREYSIRTSTIGSSRAVVNFTLKPCSICPFPRSGRWLFTRGNTKP